MEILKRYYTDFGLIVLCDDQARRRRENGEWYVETPPEKEQPSLWCKDCLSDLCFGEPRILN